jgi:hypothetical protein
MTWLVWKDFRLNRLIFIVAAVLLVLPFVIPVVVTWYQTGYPFPRNAINLRNNLAGSCFWSLGLLQLTMALAGGNAIACERMDRSAEFLAYLPVSRGRILASKLLVALGLVAMVWLPNLVMIVSIAGHPAVLVDTRFLTMFGLMATTGLTLFCVAWFFSAILQSPTFSVCLGLLPPIIVGMCVVTSMATQLHGSDRTAQTLGWYRNLYLGTCLSLAAVCFVGGTFCYLRRVEP